jgi:hypothetical protein
MSQVVSIRLPDEQAEQLKRQARRLGKTPSETGAQLIDEALRASTFAYIEFRNSPVGRQAYIKASTLAVWEVIAVGESYSMDAALTSAHFEWPVHRVQAAFQYARAYPDEIHTAIADNRSMTFEQLKRMFPQAEEFVVTDGDEAGENEAEESPDNAGAGPGWADIS